MSIAPISALDGMIWSGIAKRLKLIEYLTGKLPGPAVSGVRDASILKIARYSSGSNLSSALTLSQYPIFEMASNRPCHPDSLGWLFYFIVIVKTILHMAKRETLFI